MKSQEEGIDWGSFSVLCPFCAANQCSGECLHLPTRTPASVENTNSSSVAGDHLGNLASPRLAQAVIEVDGLIRDEDEEDNDDLLYTISKSLHLTDTAHQDLEAAKRHLESLMLHHLHYSRSRCQTSERTTSEAHYIDPEFFGYGRDELVSNVKVEISSDAKPLDIGGPVSQTISYQNSAVAMVRSKVSQAKRRYQKEGFDLDLTYITPRIIAMGFPAWGTEKYYRNPIDQVELFFERKHAGHYRIYNLCSERPEYDSPKRFQGNFKRFPFDDHNAPCPITLILDFVRDAMAFLKEDEQNIVGVHCKAGKGRTGIMISCLLRSIDPLRITNAEEALRFFDEARTYNCKGVTIPSQIRYVHYYDHVLKEFSGKFPSPRTLKLYQITIDSAIKTSGNVDLYFTIEERGLEKIDSRRYFPNGPVKDPKGCLFIFPDEPELEGDLRFVFYQRRRLVDERLFHFWLNTSLCSTHEHLSHADRQLDGRLSKMKEGETFCKDLAAHILFVDDCENNSKDDTGVHVREDDSGVAPQTNTSTGINSLQKTLQRFMPKLFTPSRESPDAEPPMSL